MTKNEVIYELEEVLLQLPKGFICPSVQEYIRNIVRKLKKENKNG